MHNCEHAQLHTVGGRGASAARGSCGGGSGEQRQVRVIGTPVSS